MKKIIDWFNEVSDADLKSKLLNNIAGSQWSNKEVDNFEEAVHSGFYWYSSPEGWDFWSKVTGGKYAPKA